MVDNGEFAKSYCYFLFYLSIIKLMFRSILISHHIFILLQMPIASNLSSEFRLLVFFQTPLGLGPIEACHNKFGPTHFGSRGPF